MFETAHLENRTLFLFFERFSEALTTTNNFLVLIRRHLRDNSMSMTGFVENKSRMAPCPQSCGGQLHQGARWSANASRDVLHSTWFLVEKLVFFLFRSCDLAKCVLRGPYSSSKRILRVTRSRLQVINQSDCRGANSFEMASRTA